MYCCSFTAAGFSLNPSDNFPAISFCLFSRETLFICPCYKAVLKWTVAPDLVGALFWPAWKGIWPIKGTSTRFDIFLLLHKFFAGILKF